jgi:deazaflavin-dependent oxidoreductase (nitroreductase family)
MVFWILQPPSSKFRPSVRAPRKWVFHGYFKSRVMMSRYLNLMMSSPAPEFRAPSPVERVFNRVFGFLVGLGLGFSHNYLLQVRGRKSGRLYSTPIDLLELEGKRFLVAPRGRTQWVRNAEAAGEVVLKKGRIRQPFRLRPIPDPNKAEILKAYLDTFEREVQRYFPVPAGSPVQAFRELTPSYPVFELIAV